MDSISVKKFIDLEEVIRSKNPRLLKFLPVFILNFIRKIIHEREINEFLKNHGNEYDFDFLSSVLEEFELNIKVIGEENIPVKEGCIFVANHPLGGLDAISMMHEIGKIRKDIKFLVNDILLSIANVRSLFIPINKHGRNSPEIIANIENTYASDQAVLIFPAGLVSRKKSQKIQDLEWRKSFIMMSKKHKKDVIPVFIDGKNSDFFYTLARWRKVLGIKANIEMFFLVNEMYKQKGKTITLKFGKLVSYKTFDSSLNDKKWAEKIRAQVYSLEKNS